jgi:hypothetical protein
VRTQKTGAGNPNFKHGHAGKKPSREYSIWVDMRRRCCDPSRDSYESYGARGISVCDRWLGKGGFINFLADMGLRPSPRHQIDRINNDGPYAPWNCHWVLPVPQANNRRGNRLVTIDGRTQTASQWEREADLPRGTVKARLRRCWPSQRLLSPVDVRFSHRGDRI